MSKTPFEGSENLDDELLAEYHLDYKKAKLNRFATVEGKQLLKVVVLDKDVAQVFTTPELVNSTLRALIESMPQTTTVQSNNPVETD
jgi:uncharacterized protein with von Willebrand factor type A (vWA) domain